MKKIQKKKYNIDNLRRIKTEKTVLACAAALALLFTFVLGIARVSGHSMDPTLSDGELVLFFRLKKGYGRGDIVSVHMPSGEYLVKRVIAVEGDEVDIKDGIVLINGEPENGSYPIAKTEQQRVTVEYPLVVEEGKIFVLGDNRELSVDSRTYGQFAESQTHGKILFVK